MHRCAARGCGRWTRAGAIYCGRHDPDASTGNLAATHVHGGEGENGHAAYRARLATGDYEEVIGVALRRVLRDAAADSALDEEIGALRVAMARLLREESDPSRLAAGVARIASVAVRAATLRGGDTDRQGIAAMLAKTLDEIEREGLSIVTRSERTQAVNHGESPSLVTDGPGALWAARVPAKRVAVRANREGQGGDA